MSDAQRYLKDFTEFMDKSVLLKDQPLYFLGHSTGVPVGFEYAILNPQKFKRMLLLSPLFAIRAQAFLRVLRGIVGPFLGNDTTLPFQKNPHFDKVTESKIDSFSLIPRLQWRWALAKNLPNTISQLVTKGWFDGWEWNFGDDTRSSTSTAAE